MSTAFLQRDTVVRIRNAARRGPLAFLLQAGLIVLDLLLCKKHLVVRADAAHVDAAKLPPLEGVSFTEILPWATLQLVVSSQPTLIPTTVDLGHPDWFDKGWRLRVDEAEVRLACLGWRRTAEQSQGSFRRMLRGSERPRNVARLPDFLGRNHNLFRWTTVMRRHLGEGFRVFYTNCRDYGVPSHCDIERIGSCAADSRLTGRRKLPPMIKEDYASQ